MIKQGLAYVIIYALSMITLISIAYAGKNPVSNTISISRIVALPSQPNTTGSIALMSLNNQDSKTHYLTGCYSSIAKTSMLHGFKNGYMKRVTKISLAAKSKTHFSSKGKHIMLIGLKKKLKSGMKISLILYFEDGSKKKITATIK
jgi:copper(I)-binding protein